MRSEIIKSELFKEFSTRELCAIAEVANDQGDEHLSIARVRVEPGVVTEWHELLHTDERYIIIQGCGRVEIQGLRPVTVQPGDVVRVAANTPQRIANTGHADLLFYCICTPRFDPQCYVSRTDLS